jgi:fatty-acid desaturase
MGLVVRAGFASRTKNLGTSDYHHAFPTSYRHGLRRWQIDPAAGVIRVLELLGLARDVVRVDERRLAGKAIVSTS